MTTHTHTHSLCLVTSVFGAFGRALFGGDTSVDDETTREEDDALIHERSCHGKEELIVWDECAMSDDEGDKTEEGSPRNDPLFYLSVF